MPRVKKSEVKPTERTAAQLANDARMKANPIGNRAKAASQKEENTSPLETPDFYVSKNLLGPDDVQMAQENISISTTGEATADRTLIIEPVEPSKMVMKAENEKYMNELVEIQIEADDDPNAPLFVHSGHQGVTQYIKRGEPQKIKRKFLYSLIAAKIARLVCSFGKDQNGQEFNRLEGPRRSTHRVIVINDTARGRADYTRWMQEA